MNITRIFHKLSTAERNNQALAAFSHQNLSSQSANYAPINFDAQTLPAHAISSLATKGYEISGIKFYLILFISILLAGCGSRGRCQSEIEVYKNSLSEDSDFMPILTREIRDDDHIYNNELSNSTNETWISRHDDTNQMLIGEHYIYWRLQGEESRLLEPAK